MDHALSEEARQQIVTFLNNVLNFPSTNLIMHEVLSARGLEITYKTPLANLCDVDSNTTAGIDSKNKEAFRNFAIPRLGLLKQRYFDKHGHAMKDEELRKVLPTLISKFLSLDPSKSEGPKTENASDLAGENEDIALIEKDLESLTELTVSTAPMRASDPMVRHRNNKEQSILQFIMLCNESKSIISSVDMYNNYRKWCTQSGVGYCSAPTLTKYLRESDRKHTESVSEKGRSQGWYLTTP